MFYIRTDGNSKIGAGHVMRCLSIAEALRDLGEVVLFLTADETSVKLIENRGFGYLVLDTAWDDMEGELPKLLTVIKENKIEKLLVDSYQATERYMHTLYRYAKIAYMDDYGDKAYPVDVLINYNMDAPGIDYKGIYEKSAQKLPKLLLGGAYAPVRKEFGNTDYKIRESVRDILLTTGGADKYGAAIHILEKLRQETAKDPLLCCHVASGAYNEHAESLKNAARGDSHIYFYENVPDMWNLMKKCDLAISAAGSTLYELAAIGVPTVYFYFVDNQEKNAQAFETLAKNAGNYASDPDGTIKRLMHGVEEYRNDCKKRAAAHEKMRQKEFENGIFKLAEELKNYGNMQQ